MRKLIQIFLIVIFASFFTLSVPAQVVNQNKNYLQQQMILMGLYIYGINQELAQKVPSTDELMFLADSILDIAAQAKKVENNKPHHSNLDELLDTAEQLKKACAKHDQLLAQTQAKNLLNSCAKCHSQR